MNRADRDRWQAARILEDLGEIGARWYERTVSSRPGCAAGAGPDDEDSPAIPVLAALNRAGYFTDAEQDAFDGSGFDGVRWQQRAAVDGFASAVMADRLRRAAEQAGLIVIAHDPAKRPRWKISYRRAEIVTLRDAQPHTGFGAHLSRRHICDPHTGYGICRPDAIAALCGAWQVAVIDPAWGRQDLLWNTLAGLTEPR